MTQKKRQKLRSSYINRFISNRRKINSKNTRLDMLPEDQKIMGEKAKNILNIQIKIRFKIGVEKKNRSLDMTFQKKRQKLRSSYINKFISNRRKINSKKGSVVTRVSTCPFEQKKN